MEDYGLPNSEILGIGELKLFKRTRELQGNQKLWEFWSGLGFNLTSEQIPFWEGHLGNTQEELLEKVPGFTQFGNILNASFFQRKKATGFWARKRQVKQGQGSTSKLGNSFPRETRAFWGGWQFLQGNPNPGFEGNLAKNFHWGVVTPFLISPWVSQRKERVP